MKKLNKIASLVLALVLALSLAIPAMAADTHTITIGDAVEGEVYKAYKLFDVTYSNVTTADEDNAAGTDITGGNFTYTIVKDSAAWNTLVAAGMTAAADGSYAINGFTMTLSAKANIYNVAASADADAAALAAALNAIKDDSSKFTIPVAGQDTAVKADGAEKATAAITVREDGYYFVDSSLGALCGLNTTTPDVTINEKNSTTSIDKTVKDADDAYAKAIDSKIGETVDYQVVVNVPASADGTYTVTDVLTAGLTFDADTLTCDAKDYAANTEVEGATYVITFDGAVNAGKTVTITYSAVVNENAIIAASGNKNDVTLEYGQQSTTDTARVYTYEFSLLKYTGSKETPTKLEGAEFALYQGDTKLTFDKTDYGYMYNVEGKGEYDQIPVGTALIYGLDIGTYTLKEVVVPAGYNATADITVDIAADINTDNTAVVTISNGEKDATGKPVLLAVTCDGTTYDVGVLNQSGTVMPSTGGIGTTIFYVVGGLLVVCAGVILVSKKRMGA